MTTTVGIGSVNVLLYLLLMLEQEQELQQEQELDVGRPRLESGLDLQQERPDSGSAYSTGTETLCGWELGWSCGWAPSL